MFVNGMSCLFVFLPFFFLVNNIGENVSIAFDAVNESMYEMKWYACPLDLQKYFIPMIGITQRSHRIPVFAVYDCCRDTFKRVRFVYLDKNKRRE